MGIQFSSQAVTLRVTDNGRGFNLPNRPSGFATSGHMGLLGLYERSEMIGARLEIMSKPGEGSQVIIVVPISPEVT